MCCRQPCCARRSAISVPLMATQESAYPTLPMTGAAAATSASHARPRGAGLEPGCGGSRGSSQHLDGFAAPAGLPQGLPGGVSSAVSSPPWTAARTPQQRPPSHTTGSSSASSCARASRPPTWSVSPATPPSYSAAPAIAELTARLASLQASMEATVSEHDQK